MNNSTFETVAKRKPHPRMPKVELVCPTCKKPFLVNAGQHRHRPRVHCSRDCLTLAQCGSLDPVEAFWLKVDKTSHAGGCWLYMGFRKWDGYGWLARSTGGRVRYMTAHRYAWILTHGEVTNGLHVLHRCDNPPCCNPAHLFLGTHDDNMKDRTRKGRSIGQGRIHFDRVRPERKVA